MLWYVHRSMEKHLLPTEFYSPQNTKCLAKHVIFIISFLFRRDSLLWRAKTVQPPLPLKNLLFHNRRVICYF